MAVDSSSPRRVWNLALAFQEVFTAVVRLRFAGQSVNNAEAFRNHLKQALQLAVSDAQSHGYNPDDIQKAAFAVVVYVDESVFNSRNPAFSDWHRMPLQEEFYGGHVGGETFFQDLQGGLARPDSIQTADLLEVYYLCLLLGYRGRYGAGGASEVAALAGMIRDKIRRIRGQSLALSPRWELPPEAPPPLRKDPWIARLIVTAGVILVIGVLLFGVMKFRLVSGVSALHAIAAQSRS
jgi:type VI secretion system protein ImpK